MAERVYEPPQRDDGFRVLVDRLWPRGVSEERAQLALWLREAAPSDALRKWFAHDPRKWLQFQQRYCAELKGQAEVLRRLRRLVRMHHVVTLVCAASDTRHNNAVVLAGVLNRSR